LCNCHHKWTVQLKHVLPGPEHPEEDGSYHGEEVAGVVGSGLLTLSIGLVVQYPAVHTVLYTQDSTVQYTQDSTHSTVHIGQYTQDSTHRTVHIGQYT
jgi:hypothetical protein